MTDISKCRGDGCDRKERCWRYIAPSAGQSWQTWIMARDCIAGTPVTQPFDLFWPATPKQIAEHGKP